MIHIAKVQKYKTTSIIDDKPGKPVIDELKAVISETNSAFSQTKFQKKGQNKNQYQ